MKRNRFYSRRQFLQSTAGAAGLGAASATVLLESTPAPSLDTTVIFQR